MYQAARPDTWKPSEELFMLHALSLANLSWKVELLKGAIEVPKIVWEHIYIKDAFNDVKLWLRDCIKIFPVDAELHEYFDISAWESKDTIKLVIKDQYLADVDQILESIEAAWERVNADVSREGGTIQITDSTATAIRERLWWYDFSIIEEAIFKDMSVVSKNKFRNEWYLNFEDKSFDYPNGRHRITDKLQELLLSKTKSEIETLFIPYRWRRLLEEFYTVIESTGWKFKWE